MNELHQNRVRATVRRRFTLGLVALLRLLEDLRAKLLKASSNDLPWTVPKPPATLNGPDDAGSTEPLAGK
jgi:hypothetical protein